MLIGYARISSTEQDYSGQIALLEAQGCEKIFVEKKSGISTAPRKELKNTFSHLREGDTLIVTKIDRLAHSIIDLNKIIIKLKNKGVNVKFINDNLEFNVNEKLNRAHAVSLFEVLGAFAQFERDLILEQSIEGRERAKSRGKHLGRPAQPKSKIKQALDLYANRKSNQLSVAEISNTTGVPKSTIYNELKKSRANESYLKRSLIDD